MRGGRKQPLQPSGGNPFPQLVQSSANIPCSPLLPPKPPGCCGPWTPDGRVDLTASTAQQVGVLQHDPATNGANLVVRPPCLSLYGCADLIWAVLLLAGHFTGHRGKIKPAGAGGGMQPCARRRQALGAKPAVPGVADEHVGGSESGVIPLHASLLVQHQDVGPEAIGGQDSLVCDRLGRSIVDM